MIKLEFVDIMVYSTSNVQGCRGEINVLGSCGGIKPQAFFSHGKHHSFDQQIWVSSFSSILNHQLSATGFFFFAWY